MAGSDSGKQASKPTPSDVARVTGSKYRFLYLDLVDVHPGGTKQPPTSVFFVLQQNSEGIFLDARVLLERDGEPEGEEQTCHLDERTELSVQPGAEGYEIVCCYRSICEDEYEVRIPLKQSDPARPYEFGKPRLSIVKVGELSLSDALKARPTYGSGW